MRGKPLEQLRESALRSMAAVNKRRNNREPQVSESSGAQAGCRSVGRELCRKRKCGKPEEQPEQQPNIRVQNEIFVGLNPCQTSREKAKRRRTRKSRSPGETRANLSVFDHSSRPNKIATLIISQSISPPIPISTTSAPVAAFHSDSRRLHVKRSRNILPAKRGRSNAIAVRPAFIVESAYEIIQRISPSVRCASSLIGLLAKAFPDKWRDAKGAHPDRHKKAKRFPAPYRWQLAGANEHAQDFPCRHGAPQINAMLVASALPFPT